MDLSQEAKEVLQYFTPLLPGKEARVPLYAIQQDIPEEYLTEFFRPIAIHIRSSMLDPYDLILVRAFLLYFSKGGYPSGIRNLLKELKPFDAKTLIIFYQNKPEVHDEFENLIGKIFDAKLRGESIPNPDLMSLLWTSIMEYAAPIGEAVQATLVKMRQ